MQKKTTAKKRQFLFRWVGIVLSLVGLTALLVLTAFAQNTYVITDGDQVTVYTSFSADPAKVLDEAGVELDEQDYYTTDAGDGVSEITVQRAMPVTVDHCGVTLETTSYGETVGELLDRLGVETGVGYQLSEPLSTEIRDGMHITVASIVEAQETYTVEIPFEITYCEDPTLPAGEEKIVVEGVPGQMLCTANVVYCNTQEQQRNVTEQTMLEQPVRQIVAVGTGEAVGESLPIIGDGFIILPTGEVLTYTHTEIFEATAYTHTDEGCDMITANGNRVKVGVVAVDPKVIPYGTRMFIVTKSGSYIYGVGTAEDCGGGIKGNRLDLYMETPADCVAFGRRDCIVYFLGDANWK